MRVRQLIPFVTAGILVPLLGTAPALAADAVDTLPLRWS